MVINGRLGIFKDTVHLAQICIERGNITLAREQYCQLAAMYASIQYSSLPHAEKVRAHAALTELHQVLTSTLYFGKADQIAERSLSQAALQSPFPSLPTSLPPSILPSLQPPSLAAQDSHHVTFIFGAGVILAMLGSSVFIEPTLVGLATVNLDSTGPNQLPFWLKDELFVRGTTVFNLNQYVVDPDGDSLVFEAIVESGSITATVEGEYLSIVAEKPGLAFVIVTASDLKSIRRARLRVISS